MIIAFLTAGGLAPCLSSSIGRLVEQYENILPNSEMIGYLNGYKGLLLGRSIQFSDEVNKYNIGDKVTLTLVRKQRFLKVDITLKVFPVDTDAMYSQMRKPS